MAKYNTSVASETAVIDWTDLFAVGQVLNGLDVSEIVVRCGRNTRIAAGVADPGASASAGVPVVADQALTAVYNEGVANKTLWVQSPASQDRINVEVDFVATGKTVLVTS